MPSRPERLQRAAPAFLLAAVLLFAGCGTGDNEKKPPGGPALKETLIRANKQFVRSQLSDIDAYIERKGYAMDSTGTGLRYRIRPGGGGRRPDSTGTVTIAYRTELLDGRPCYDSDSLGPMTVSMDYGDVPPGLREGLFLMAEGDQALFILPAHLAYGLTGDHACIPPNAALVMQVKVEKIE
jgi:FKBP-type peptidyl-prolyl cis-trans isomerase